MDPQQGADYRLWVRNTLTPALADHGVGGGLRLRLRLEKQESPITWVKVTLPAKDKDIHISLAWRNTLGGGWRLDASKTARNAERWSANMATRRKYDVSL